MPSASMDPSILASIPPGVDPADYLQQLRKQRIADFLTQQSLTPPEVQQPSSGVKGVYQAARVSPLSTVAKLAEALMGSKATDDANQVSAQNYAKGLAAFNGIGAQGPAPVSAPQPNAGIGTGATSGGYGGGAGASDAQQPNAPVSQQPVVNKYNPLSQPAAPLMKLYMSDPSKYLEAIKGTPEWMTAVAAYGGNQRAAMGALQAKYAKEGAISNRSGEENLIPDGTNADGSIRYRNVRTPNLSPDMDYTRDPVTGGIIEAHNIPGAVVALANQKGATTGAEVANTPRMIPQGGGVEKLGYPGDSGVGLPPALRVPQTPGTPQLPSPGQNSTPKPQYFPPPPASPASGGPSPLPQKDQNGIFENNLWSNIPKMQIPQTPGQSSNAYQQAIVASAAKKHQELVDKYGEQSGLSTQALQYLTEAEKSLPKAETGPLAEWLTEHRGKLVEIMPNLGPILGTGTVTPTLELNKNLTQAALQGARSTFGRLTQQEVMLQKDEMAPSVSMTHDALASLIRQAKMKASYGIQQDRDYSEYHAANGDPNRFESQYNVRRPITRFSAQYDTPPAALERLKQNPSALPDFKAKYGWDPTQ